MGAIYTLIKLQFKAGFSTDKSSSTPKALKLFFYSVLVIAALFALITVYGLVTQQFTQTLNDSKGAPYTLSKQFFSLTIVGFHALQILFIIPILLKNLDINNERETLLRLPVSRTQIFISKIIVSYLYEIIFTAFIMVPILISYGAFAKMGVAYWLMIPFALVFLPAFPFFISALLLYPIMAAIRFLKSRSVLTFLAYLAVVGAISYVYMQVLTNVAMMMIFSQGMGDLLEASSPTIIGVAKIFVFENIFMHMFLSTIGYQLLNLLLAIVTGAVFAFLAVLILDRIFKSTFAHDHRKKFVLKRKRESRPRSATLAITVKEIKNIFRSTNYSFQFFMIIILIPFFAFFCTNIASYTTMLSFGDAGESAVASEYTQGIIFGIALFVVSVMVPLANSFAATNISREAGNIYHTKVIPVSYRKQLMIKFLVCLIPTLISLLISSLLLLIPVQYSQLMAINPTLTVGEAFLLFLITGLLSTGFISMGTLIDLKRPLCSAIGNAAGGELTTSTRQVNLVILIGVSIGALIGLSVFFSEKATSLFFGLNLKIVYVIGAAIVAVTGFLLLFLTGTKAYHRLEQ